MFDADPAPEGERDRGGAALAGRAADGAPAPHIVGVGATLAVAVTVLAPLTALAQVPAGTRALYLVCTGALLLGGTLGLWLCERAGARRAVVGLLIGLCALAAVVVWASGGVAWQAVMPLISLVVLFGSTRLGAALALAYLAEVTWLAVGGAQGWLACGGYVAASVFVIAFSLMVRRERAVRERAERLAADLEHAYATLRTYATQVEDLAAAKERNRIAREIHDSLGHFLTVAHVQIEAARAQLGRDPDRAAECLSRAARLTQDGLTDVRRSVALLRAAPTEARPLVDAVAGLVDEVRAAGVDTRLTVAGAPTPLAAPIEFALYRAAQESLTNLRRHASASRATLALTYATDVVRLRVADDGVGAARTDGGFGLLGLRERVQLVGGTVAIETAVGAGFALEVCVPL